MSNLGKCARCNKTVYSQEGFTAVKTQFHRSCFKCEVCNWQLTLTSYKSINGSIYCSNHYPMKGLSVAPEKGTTSVDDVTNKVALNAPKVNTVNDQVRGTSENAPQSIDMVTANALKAPKQDVVNNQIRGTSENAPQSIDIVTANALKAPKQDVVNHQVRGTSENASQSIDIVTANALKAPKVDNMTGYQKSGVHN